VLNTISNYLQNNKRVIRKTKVNNNKKKQKTMTQETIKLMGVVLKLGASITRSETELELMANNNKTMQIALQKMREQYDESLIDLVKQLNEL
jgi:hypothetical protein